MHIALNPFPSGLKVDSPRWTPFHPLQSEISKNWPTKILKNQSIHNQEQAYNRHSEHVADRASTWGTQKGRLSNNINHDHMCLQEMSCDRTFVTLISGKNAAAAMCWLLPMSTLIRIKSFYDPQNF